MERSDSRAFILFMWWIQVSFLTSSKWIIGNWALLVVT
jgi:hypothetical protein